MNKTVSIKRVVTLITALSMVIALFGAFNCIKADAATTEVSMYSSELYFSKYGISTRFIYVKTDNNAFDQQVTVHYNYLDGEWKDSEASYFTTLSDGSKIWKATISSYNTEYAIKYVADGVTYWDNNNGQNYTNETAGTAPVAVSRGRVFYGYDQTIRASVQNYAYDKNVVVRYTTDNWNSYTDTAMSYVSTNSNGTEDWAANIKTYTDDFSGFEFCVYYEVNGQTYWANNFNQNYDASYRVYP